MAFTITVPLERIEKEFKENVTNIMRLKSAWEDFKSAVMTGGKQQIRKTLEHFHEEASNSLFTTKQLATEKFEMKYPVYWLARKSVLQDDCQPPDQSYIATGSHTTTSTWHFTTTQLSNADEKINNLLEILDLDKGTQKSGNDFESYITKLNSITERVVLMARQVKELPDVLQKLTYIRNMLSFKSTDNQTSSETASVDEGLSQLKYTVDEILQTVNDVTQNAKHALPSNTIINRSDNEQSSKHKAEMVPKHEMAVDVNKDIASLKSEIASLQREITSLKDNERRLTVALQSAELDKNYWISRMSEATGTKLKDNNPGITDLSDPNRPQKLAEQYGELYDNEWTEALEKITETNVNEKQAVILLCGILKESYEKCEGHAKKQICDIERQFLGAQTGKKHTGQNENISFRKALRDAQKAMSDAVKSTVIKEIQGQMVKHKALPQSFITSSLRICWGMVAQDPPLVFLYPDCGKDKKIDLDSFTLYTRSGEGIETVVWPAMLLHKGGAVLRKGVVQPYKKK